MSGKAPPKGTISWYKKKLDSIFSLYIRNKYADSDGLVKCFTCGAVKEIKKIQNGHFVSRQYLATRWEEDNCRPQCWGCNGFGGGKLLDFEDNLVEDVGAERVAELKASRHRVVKLSTVWYEEQIKIYKDKLKEING